MCAQMRRGAGKALERIARWRGICPDLTIRSTFIVGFPGETDADFRLLLDWLGEAEIDRVDCFRYSRSWARSPTISPRRFRTR